MTPRRLRVSEQVVRPASWGDQPPVDDDEARRRLLDAAEACYERRGVSRTTVDDIAKEASVHRTTVYRYFGTRDDVLAFVLLRETADVIDSAERAMLADGAFGDRLLDALDGAIGAVEQSRWLSVLFSPDSLTMTVSAAASGAFRDRIRDVLRPHVEAGKASGDVREQLDPDAVADWLVRVAQMLLMDHLTTRPDETRPQRRALLRDFVIPGILTPARERR
ncbi:TetR/AcrR family transcriptional regulator [Mycolicibacterium madagascariense]|uniref:TetR/AcrR family transcriptional regulator n=1 Tax=Mycolicibacterium madagascariense TaxID=212765 RepID=UPI0013D66A79|nr:TetR/AcrR family transcriptional regulator [Mycolicibacterium madagascariense]MCV7013399.1 TetR/AcrR family transcriptional regulator [Mycolicibacterium madagascariense]